MTTQPTALKVAHPLDLVNPQLNTQLPLFPDSVTHHKVLRPGNQKIVYYRNSTMGKGYGVSRSRRVLSPQLLLKRFDQVRDCLQDVCGLTCGQREVTLKLLRLWAYYGEVYPKASSITEEPGSRHSTFWRTINVLQEHKLVIVVNRFLVRPHAQISNLYRMDKLVLLIARYLAEHGAHFCEKWLQPYLSMPGSQFWPGILLRRTVGFRLDTPVPG